MSEPENSEWSVEAVHRTCEELGKDPASFLDKKRHGSIESGPDGRPLFAAGKTARPAAGSASKKPRKKPAGQTKVERELAAEAAEAKTATPDESVEEIAEAMRVYWLDDSSKYVIMPADADAAAQSLPGDEISRRLRIRKVSARGGEDASRADHFFQHVQDERMISWKGRLSGKKTGIYTIGGERLAVVRAFHATPPVRGDFSLIETVLASAFEPVDGISQRDYLQAWLRSARQALDAGVSRPGYLLFLIGAVRDAKSFLVSQLIKPILGGRSADPLPHLREADNFNEDLCGNELLWVDELKGCKPGPLAQAAFGEALKELAVQQEARLRAMRSGAVMVPVWRRVVVSHNDEPDKMALTPRLTSDYRDKAMLLKTQRANLPIDTSTPEGWGKLGAEFSRELPAYVYWLLNEWQCPEGMMDGEHVPRFGHRAFIHPDLAAVLFEQSDESVLLRALDSCDIYPRDLDGTPVAWGPGKVDNLRTELRMAPHEGQLDKILENSGWFNSLFGKLASQVGARFERIKIKSGPEKGQHRWRVHPPAR